MSDPLQPHGLYSPWNSPSQNTRVGSLSRLQGNLPNPGVEPRSPALQVDSLPAEPQLTINNKTKQPVHLPGHMKKTDKEKNLRYAPFSSAKNYFRLVKSDDT